MKDFLKQQEGIDDSTFPGILSRIPDYAGLIELEIPVLDKAS